MWLAHLLGGALGGGGVAAAAWLILAPVRAAVPVLAQLLLVACVGVLAILVDLHVLRRPVLGRQVPSTWYRRYGPIRAYWMFGIFLGGGLTAHIPHAITYSIFIAIASVGSFAQATACGVVFGIGRTLLVGPGALAAEKFGRLLYVSPTARLVFPKLSAALSGLVVALAVSTAV